MNLGLALSAGFPLIIVNALSSVVILVWWLNGSGKRLTRGIVSALYVVSLGICWCVFLKFGFFHVWGSISMGMGFVVSTLAFLVPVLHRKAIENVYT